MPYKNPEAKKEWERLHRSHRLARRRELRRPQATEVSDGAVESVDLLWLSIAAGGALAAYNQTLAVLAGGLTLAVAVTKNKDWRWWVVGVLVLALALFFLWRGQKEKE